MDQFPCGAESWNPGLVHGDGRCRGAGDAHSARCLVRDVENRRGARPGGASRRPTCAVRVALYVKLKPDGELAQRARRAAIVVWPAQLALTLSSLVATWFVRPSIK